MRDAGLAPEVVGRLVCPIGLTDIRSKEPAVIAAGVAAQLLLERERVMAVKIPSRRSAADGGGA
jgi:xanthine dehydrogenase accessory factor